MCVLETDQVNGHPWKRWGKGRGWDEEVLYLLQGHDKQGRHGSHLPGASDLAGKVITGRIKILECNKCCAEKPWDVIKAPVGG